MVYSSLGKRAIASVLAVSFMVSGCLPSDVASSRQNTNTVTPGGEATAGAGAGTSTGTTTGGADTSINPTVEIRHLIEPNLSTDPTYSTGTGYAGGGSYLRKLTLPKNFAGKLYLAGINIGTLSNRLVKVRFKFGMGMDPITIPGIVASAPGITPQTNISVLVMDLRSEPFRTVRLPYDLYDYNAYGTSDTPVQDNRNSGLYCRGLKLDNDPTHTGTLQCSDANPQSKDICLYSYAKVLDQGLVKEVVNGSTITLVPLTPSMPQARSVSGNAYYQDYMGQNFMKPLLDNVQGPFRFSEPSFPAGVTDSIGVTFKTTVMKWGAELINGAKYYYRGPYRLVNFAEWEYRFSDPTLPIVEGNRKGLFRSSMPFGTNPNAVPYNNQVYFGSMMFPLATQLNIAANVPHLSSSAWDGVREETTLFAAGKTLWMDGSNARVQSRNADLEHIGSCNVTATIEIIARDKNGNEYIVDKSNEVKLQLVRPTQYYTDAGTDVLYTNFKTCSTNATCGGNECCFNNRCWDEKLVSQCYEANGSNGNKPIGDTCGTDLDCTSLCCNRSSGLCAPHNTISTPAVLCSKSIGDFCIAKDWCQKTPIVKCLIVKTGTNPQGGVTCRQQCYTVEEFGDCKAGICIAPFQETIPVFDPLADGACSSAVPAPRF